jgi:transposase InsO family protein
LEKLSSVHKRTLNRLQELMLEYEFTMAYRPGSQNAVADFLSRNVPMAAVSATIGATADEVMQKQQEDPQVKDIAQYLKARTTPEKLKGYSMWIIRCAENCFLDKEGIVWMRSKRPGYRIKDLIVVPESMRDMIIRAAHVAREAGHGGEKRTTDRVMSCYWWPGVTQHVKTFIQKCERCQLAKAEAPAPGRLHPLPMMDAPNIRLHADLFGPLKTGGNGNKYILVLTDAFSKLAELVAIENKEAVTVARAIFERWICRYSAPQILVTDQGKEFCNKVLEAVCNIWGIKKNRTSPFHPQSNSAAESYNRTMIKYMRCVLDNKTTLDWEVQLPALMMAYNMHVHASTKETPFFLTFAHDPRLPFFDLAQPRKCYTDTYPETSFQQVQLAFKQATENMMEAQEIREKYYNAKSKERDFRPGERVMVHCPNVPVGINQKFYKKWRLMVVVKRVGPLNLQIKEEGKMNTSLVHVDRVKHASAVEIEEHCDSAARTYEHGQQFAFDRGEVPKPAKTAKRKIPPEEQEKDEMEYTWQKGGDQSANVEEEEESEISNHDSSASSFQTAGSAASSAHSSEIEDEDDPLNEATVGDDEEGEEEPLAESRWPNFDPWGRIAANLFPAPQDDGRVTRSRARAEGTSVPDYALPSSDRAYNKRKDGKPRK